MQPRGCPMPPLVLIGLLMPSWVTAPARWSGPGHHLDREGGWGMRTQLTVRVGERRAGWAEAAVGSGLKGWDPESTGMQLCSGAGCSQSTSWLVREEGSCWPGAPSWMPSWAPGRMAIRGGTGSRRPQAHVSVWKRRVRWSLARYAAASGLQSPPSSWKMDIRASETSAGMDLALPAR